MITKVATVAAVLCVMLNGASCRKRQSVSQVSSVETDESEGENADFTRTLRLLKPKTDFESLLIEEICFMTTHSTSTAESCRRYVVSGRDLGVLHPAFPKPEEFLASTKEVLAKGFDAQEIKDMRPYTQRAQNLSFWSNVYSQNSDARNDANLEARVRQKNNTADVSYLKSQQHLEKPGIMLAPELVPEPFAALNEKTENLFRGKKIPATFLVTALAEEGRGPHVKKKPQSIKDLFSSTLKRGLYLVLPDPVVEASMQARRSIPASGSPAKTSNLHVKMDNKETGAPFPGFSLLTAQNHSFLNRDETNKPFVSGYFFLNPDCGIRLDRKELKLAVIEGKRTTIDERNFTFSCDATESVCALVGQKQYKSPGLIRDAELVCVE